MWDVGSTSLSVFTRLPCSQPARDRAVVQSRPGASRALSPESACTHAGILYTVARTGVRTHRMQLMSHTVGYDSTATYSLLYFAERTLMLLRYQGGQMLQKYLSPFPVLGAVTFY